MARLNSKGRSLLQDEINKHGEGIDATPLHNRVYECDDGDDAVFELVMAAGRAYYAHKETYDPDLPDDAHGHASASVAYDRLQDALELRVEELVAEACAQTITHADEWTDHYDDEQLAAAKHEAREWIQRHEDAAARADIPAEVYDA